jgi:hypothetical protein
MKTPYNKQFVQKDKDWEGEDRDCQNRNTVGGVECTRISGEDRVWREIIKILIGEIRKDLSGR